MTGTDTGVGKTFVAAAIVRCLRTAGVRVGAYKPAVSGSEAGPLGPVWRDIEVLADACGREFPGERICPQRFEKPLAPPVAARLEGRAVDANLLREGAAWWSGHVDVLVVEGAGGLLSPLTERESVADLARDLGFPLIVVARTGLGTINHTLLTLEAAKTRGLAIAGIVMNDSEPRDRFKISDFKLQTSDMNSDRHDPSPDTNPEEIARRGNAPILAILPHQSTAGLLQAPDFHTIDWLALMQSPAHPEHS